MPIVQPSTINHQHLPSLQDRESLHKHENFKELLLPRDIHEMSSNDAHPLHGALICIILIPHPYHTLWYVSFKNSLRWSICKHPTLFIPCTCFINHSHILENCVKTNISSSLMLQPTKYKTSTCSIWKKKSFIKFHDQTFKVDRQFRYLAWIYVCQKLLDMFEEDPFIIRYQCLQITPCLWWHMISILKLSTSECTGAIE
jgi:hypothetical protein